MILINKTFQTVTPESAEDGDIADHGFISENEPVTFRELVELLQRNFPVHVPGGMNDWAESYPETDFRTGEETIEAVHFSHENHPGRLKYWEKALAIACK